MKRVTVLFEDEELYTAIKVEAARRHRPLKDLVTEAIREWLEAQEDTALRAAIEPVRAEWQEKGGVEAGEFFGRLREEQGEPGGV